MRGGGFVDPDKIVSHKQAEAQAERFLNRSEFFEGNGSTSDSHEEFFVQNEVTVVDEKWFVTEPDEIIHEFAKLLRGPTGDGAGKRRAGEKVSWKVDPGHIQAAYRHLGYYADGEMADKDSKCHPLVHAAWRLLAVAWQDLHRDETLG